MTEQRTALVTGASRGIGASIANALSADGFFVIGTATTDAGVEAVSQRLVDTGIGVKLVLPDPDSIESVFQTVSNLGRTIDVLINNAAITQDNLFVRMSDQAWEDVVSTNLTGTFRITKSVVRTMMRQRWGRIVNLSSVVGSSGNPGQANYCATKAGMEGFTRSLALEVASRGITVNCVAPGMIETDMTTDLPDAVKTELLGRIPMSRLGQASEVADVVSFLVSDRANYITAQTIHVNGGMLAS